MAIRMTGMSSGLDTEAIIGQLMEAQKTKRTKIENKKVKLEWKQEKWKDLNTKLYKLYTGTLSKVKMQSNYNKKAATVSDDSAVKVTAASNASVGSNQIQVKEIASAQYVTSSKIENVTKDTKLESLGMEKGTTITFKAKAGTDTPKEVMLTIDEDTTISDFVNKAKEAGLNANFDEEQGRFFITSLESGKDNKFTITTDATIEKTENGTPSTVSALTALGLGNIDGSKVEGGEKFTVMEAKDSELILNGATLTSSSNIVKANGLTFELKSKTNGEIVNVNVTDDVNATYNMVKDFVKEYNEILKELNKLYGADSARDYDVLTDEQKECMSEDEIEKWEGKIKDSLLRRDSTLDSIITGMRTSIQGAIKTSSGNSYSLASLGISTSSDYTEKGILHIYGDEDDDTYASENNKLKEMLTENHEDTAEVLSQLFGKLYDDLNKKMAKTSLSSALTFYNDTQINNELRTYKKEIAKWDDRLADMEDRYYKQFSAMETAMAKLNSQSSYFSGLFGG